MSEHHGHGIIQFARLISVHRQSRRISRWIGFVFRAGFLDLESRGFVIPAAAWTVPKNRHPISL